MLLRGAASRQQALMRCVFLLRSEQLMSSRPIYQEPIRNRALALLLRVLGARADSHARMPLIQNEKLARALLTPPVVLAHV